MLNSSLLLPNLLPQNVYTQDVGEDQMAFDEFGFRLPESVANSTLQLPANLHLTPYRILLNKGLS